MARHPFEEMGRRLRLLRIRLENERGSRVTQAEIADEIGVAESTYTSWEIGRQRPTGENVAALCKLFGTTTGYLFDGRGDPGDRELELEAALDDIQRVLDRVRRGLSGKLPKRPAGRDRSRAVGEEG